MTMFWMPVGRPIRIMRDAIFFWMRICRKLIFRHPHVFGAQTAGDPEGALSAWDAQKRREKGQRTTADAMDSVARAMPALMRAEKLQGKAAKAGFDWPEIGPALDKVSEELSELRRAVEENANVEEELGGVISVKSQNGCTDFTIRIPRENLEVER